MQRLFLLIVILAWGLVPLPRIGAQEEKRDGSFGFQGKSIFKFNRGVGPVATADMNRDGRQDIVVVDSYRAEIVVLYQDPGSKGKQHGTAPNAISDPEGFRRGVIPITKKVNSLLVLDADGDEWLDLVLTGSGGLEVRWGSEAQRFDKSDRFRLRDAVSGTAVLAWDRGPGGVQVFALGRKGIHRFRAFSRVRTPERDFLPGSAGTPTALFLTDLDGDGRRDLLTVLDDAERPYRLRLRRPDGEFGAETVLEGERPAGVRPIATEGRARIVALTLGKGRFDVLGLATESNPDPLDLPPPAVFPLDSAGLENPRLLVADLDGDGDVDVAVTHRSESSILLFLNDEGSLTRCRPAPTLRKVVSLHAADLDGDSRPEVLVTSTDEKVVGASSVSERVLRFPKVVEGIEAPLLAAPGAFAGEGTQLAVVSKASGSTPTLTLHERQDGAWTPSEVTVKLEDLGGEPSDLLISDLDRDGRDEILLFVPYQTPRLYGIRGDGEARSIERIAAPGTLEKATRGAVSVTASGDLLVASANHCRRLRLIDGKPEVVYQINGQSGSSAIACAVEARLEHGKPPSLLLVDRSDRSLSVYSGDGAQPRCLRTLAGPYDRIVGGAAADLDGDGRDEILLLDPRFLAVIRTDGQRLRLTSEFTYQNPDEKSRYITAATGDLNGDGAADLVLSNGALRELHILKKGPGQRWIHALRFPVYEARSFMGSGSGPMEPRWLSITDLTGDGLKDLLILVHDRLILYPQDSAS